MTVITGLKQPIKSALALQPYTLANVAFSMGRVTRKEFLATADVVLLGVSWNDAAAFTAHKELPRLEAARARRRYRPGR